MQSRLLSFIARSGHPSIEDLIREAAQSSKEPLLEEIIEELSTNYSYFYREPVHFRFLNDTALPNIKAELERTGSTDVRVWSAAAAAGEEAYSLVMAMREFFGPTYKNLDAGVLATDIDKSALTLGTAGVYSAEALRNIPEDWKLRYFEPLDNQRYRVKPPIREDVLFRWLNLIEPAEKLRGQFHIIFCRNVMIYFDAETRERLAARLTSLLAPNGYLFISLTDSAEYVRRDLTQIQPSIFQKVR